MRIILFTILLLSTQLVAAQQNCKNSVSGQIRDIETKEPIPFSNVKLLNSTKGAIANEAGEFVINNICPDEFDLQISHIGYKTAIHHHDLYHSDPTIFLASDDKLLESVVVEGNYNQTNLESLSFSKMDKAELSNEQSLSFGELASKISGVNMLSTGQNIMKPIIHGLHSNRVLIINNGVRHEFQNWGAEHAPEIDPSLAGSLQVVKGAATVRYGSDALGGVILIDPPKVEMSSGLKAELALTGNTNGRAADGTANISQGWKNWVVSAQASVTNQGDLQAPTYKLTNTGKKEQSYAVSIRYHKNRFDLEGYYSHFYQNLGILRGSVNGNLDDLAVAMESEVPQGTKDFSYIINSPRQEVTHDLAKLNATYQLDDQNFALQYAYQQNNRQEFDVRRGSNIDIPSIDLELSSHSADFDWNHVAIGPVSGKVGVQWSYLQNVNIFGTNTVQFIPNYNTNNIGIFAIEQLEQGNITYELGLRYDYQNNSVAGRTPENNVFRTKYNFNQLTGSAGIKVKLADHSFYRSNVGMAWRPPNIAELYSYGKHQAIIEFGLLRYDVDDSNNIEANEVRTLKDKNVSSEKGFKWINSFEQHFKNFQWDATAYFNFIDNFIYTRPAGITNTVRGAFPFFIYQQTNALLAGLDVGYNYNFKKNWNTQGNLSYVWAKDVLNNENFVGMPPASIDVAISYNKRPSFLKESKLELGLEYTAMYWQAPRVISTAQIKEAQEDGINIFESDDAVFDFMAAPDGFFLPSVSWSASLSRLSWNIQINNLLDTEYRSYTNTLRYFADEAGRNFRLTIRYKIF